MVSELQRQAYLDAMGVDCYIPRLVLPAALPSQLCEMPANEILAEDQPPWEQSGSTADGAGAVGQAAVATEASTAVPTTASRSNTSAAAVQALFDDIDPNPRAKARAASNVEAGAGPKATASTIPHFHLTIVRGANVLLVDNGLSADTDSAEYLRLLQNMLHAIGAGKPQLSIDSFRWPMTKSGNVDQGETAARQTLQAFLAKQAGQLKVAYLLVMGEVAAHYLSEEALPTGSFVAHTQMDVQLIHTQSASRMLVEPAIKRQVWQDLQPLRRVLVKQL